MRRDVFQAIADPTRRDIIGLLSQQAMNLNALADHFPVSRPAISRHIKILVECDLVQVERQGRESLCRGKPQNLKPVQDWVEHYQGFWNDKLDALARHLTHMQTDSHPTGDPT